MGLTLLLPIEDWFTSHSYLRWWHSLHNFAQNGSKYVKLPRSLHNFRMLMTNLLSQWPLLICTCTFYRKSVSKLAVFRAWVSMCAHKTQTDRQTDTAEVKNEVRREGPYDPSRWSDGGEGGEERRSSKSGRQDQMLIGCSKALISLYILSAPARPPSARLWSRGDRMLQELFNNFKHMNNWTPKYVNIYHCCMIPGF